MEILEDIEIYEVREGNSKHSYECSQGKFENDDGEVAFISYNALNNDELIVCRTPIIEPVRQVEKEDILEHYEELEDAKDSKWYDALETVQKELEDE